MQLRHWTVYGKFKKKNVSRVVEQFRDYREICDSGRIGTCDNDDASNGVFVSDNENKFRVPDRFEILWLALAK